MPPTIQHAIAECLAHNQVTVEQSALHLLQPAVGEIPITCPSEKKKDALS
jgi:hypothetical protein